MTVGESPAVARRRLRLAVREAREAKGLTQREVADALDWSLSKINRIEGGEVTLSRTDLLALLELLEVTDPDRIQALTNEARTARRRGWWDQPRYREHLTPAMIQSLQFETDASQIRSLQPTLIPGHLQTHEYASAVMDTWGPALTEEDRATRIEVRMQRRAQLFNRAEPPDFLVALDESVLLRRFGGPGVTSAQLYELLGLIRDERLIVRVLPLANVMATVGMFTIYADDEGDVLVYREGFERDDIVYVSDEIRRHRQLFEMAWTQAMSREASTRLIEARAAELRSDVDRHRPGPAG